MASQEDSVLLLCNVLNKLQNSIIQPFHFVTAFSNKDNNDCVKTFWLVLHELLCTTHHDKGYVLCTKLCFTLKGFKGLSFYNLPNSVSFGSLELLLALSWLLANNCIEERIDNLITEFFDFKKTLIFQQKKAVKEMPKLDEEKNKLNFIRYILFKAGKARLAYRSHIDSLIERRACLLKVETYRNDEAVSPVFIEALQRSKFSPCHHKTALGLESLIASYMLWKSKEFNFFLWVNSALQRKVNADKKIINDSIIIEASHMKRFLQEEIKRKIPICKESSNFIFQSENQNLYHIMFLKNIEKVLKDCNLFVIRQS